MKDLVFCGLLIVAGAILAAATTIAGRAVGMFLGIPLICWGIAERIIVLTKHEKQK